MAKIRPFCAYRPAKGYEDKIAALPYDVYNRQEALLVVQKNPLSFLAIDRAETQFPVDADMYAKEVYEKARQMIAERIEKGLFVKDSQACYYLYELVMDGRKQTGIVACASIDDYQNQIIKKHENTRADKELDRIHHVDITNMQTGPIFLAYRNQKTLDEIIQKIREKSPACDFTSEDEITHRVWVIDQKEDIDTIQQVFSEMNEIYIADGHHRCASAVKVGLKRRQEHPDAPQDAEFNYFLSVLFPENELKILDYNRVVYDLNGKDKDTFLEEVKNAFVVKESAASPYHPVHKGEFGMYLDKKWYQLTIKDAFKTEDCVDGLDVSTLQNYLLDPILGIKDPKTDKRIDFVGGIRGLEELENRCLEKEGMVAFSMYPTSIQELFAVADANRLMPPKSTWFEPKLRSGLFLHELS